MTVYLVFIHHNGESRSLYGIYSTLDRANEEANALRTGGEIWVEAHQVQGAK